MNYRYVLRDPLNPGKINKKMLREMNHTGLKGTVILQN